MHIAGSQSGEIWAPTPRPRAVTLGLAWRRFWLSRLGEVGEEGEFPPGV